MVKKRIKKVGKLGKAKSISNNDYLKRNLKIIVILSVLGLLVSLYLLRDHYSTEIDAFCEAIGGGCDVVNRGPYAEIDGILMEQFGIFVTFPLPVSIIGGIGFIITIILSILILKNKCFTLFRKHFCRSEIIKLMFWLNLIGFVFALYLTYIEFIVLGTFCIYCDIAKTLFTIVLVICFINLKYAKDKSKKVCEFC